MSHPIPTQDYPCEVCGQQPDDCECPNEDDINNPDMLEAYDYEHNN